MTDHRVAIIGGSGFIGQRLVCEFARRRMPMRILTRRKERHRALLVIPGLQLVETDPYSTAALSTALQGCHSVINLAGILNEFPRPGSTFEQTHQRLPENIVEAMRFNRISRLVHISALNAAIDAPSAYLRSKAQAEQYLQEIPSAQLQLTCFRPAVVFGPGDQFFNLFARLLRLNPWCLPLACATARFAPVYVGDVTTALANSLHDKSSYGQHYDLCGPAGYTLEALVRYTASLLGINPFVVPLNDTLGRLQAGIVEKLPGKIFSLDNFLSMQVDSVSDDNALPRLHIEAQSVETIVPTYLH